MQYTHLVLIPSYNSGSKLQTTIHAAAKYAIPVWVVIDGSTDDSAWIAKECARTLPNVHVLVQPKNQGKGAAFLFGAQKALKENFTHALVMDADGQHHAPDIPRFMELSQQNPDAMILGKPVFGNDAPKERVAGRKIGNTLARINTFGGKIDDSLFGFRVYPLAPSVKILTSIRHARRFDFDTELVIRLYWMGIRPINVPTPVTYPKPQEGGVTHFHYLRDNLLLASTHIRLFFFALSQAFKKLSNFRG